MLGRGTFDRETVPMNLAKLKKFGRQFEVVVDADMAVAIKEGRDVDIKDVVKAPDIYSDAKKGLVAPENKMEEVFGTSDKEKIAREIITSGEIQLTADYRKKLREQKKRRILTIIHRNAVDPKTHLPHPMTRLENAFEQAKVNIDEFKRAEDQVQNVVAKLKVILPLRFETDEIAIKIGPNYAAKMYSVVKNYAKILRDEWQSDGSWICVVEIPAGLKQDMLDDLNKQTHGNIHARLVKTR